MKNVCKTPLVAGQWVKGEKYKYDLVVVDNKLAPEIPVAREADRRFRTDREPRGRPAMTVVLSFQDVSKNFGALKVTDDLSFEVAKGEALGVLGPNGAGKTTVFNLITGGLAPDAGAYPFQRPRHHEALRRIGAAAPASAAPIRWRCRSKA